MFTLRWYHFILTLLLCIIVAADNKKKLISLDEKYKSAKKAYSNDQWSKCISEFEETIHLNKLFNSVKGNCGHICKQESYEPIVEDSIEDLKIYEFYFRQSECFENCKKKELENLNINSEVSEEVRDYLTSLEPYNYIHICYFKMNLLPKAAGAAYTYLSAHPDDMDMKNNYQYYIHQPEVDKDEIFNLETDGYKYQYWQGTQAYQKKKWATTVTTMETVLDDYIKSENQCRLFCEDTTSYPFENVISYFKFLLICKAKCQNAIQSIGFESGTAFIADVLNHIQIGYHYLDEHKKAARAVQSYLLLLPDDGEMLNNKKIYKSFVNDSDFVEMPEIVHYHKRDTYEKKMLHHFDIKNYIE